MRKRKYILLILAFFACNGLAAQDVIQKASKQVQKEYREDLSNIIIRGEKAVITVEGWDRNYTQIILKPVSRNTNKSKAVSDLKFIKYEATIEGQTLNIKNFFNGNFEKISSNLSMEIQVYCPAQIRVEIINLYGPIKASNLNSASIDLSFGSCELQNILKQTELKLKYSNTRLQNIEGQVLIHSEKSDVTAVELAAKTEIYANYGDIKLEKNETNAALKIEAKRSGIELIQQFPEDYNYNLSSEKGKIYYYGREKGVKDQFELINAKKLTEVNISTSYCDIEINRK